MTQIPGPKIRVCVCVSLGWGEYWKLGWSNYGVCVCVCIVVETWWEQLCVCVQ